MPTTPNRRWWLIPTIFLFVLVVPPLVLIAPVALLSYRMHVREQAVQEAWRGFSAWSALDEAIRIYGSDEGYFSSGALPVPAIDRRLATPPWSVIHRDSLAFEYGGGLFHYGIIYFPDPAVLVGVMAKPDPDTSYRQLGPRLLYYRDGK